MLDTHCASQYAPYRQRAQASRVATAAATERAKMLLAQLLFRAVLSRLEAIRLALCGAGPFFVHPRCRPAWKKTYTLLPHPLRGARGDSLAACGFM